MPNRHAFSNLNEDRYLPPLMLTLMETGAISALASISVAAGADGVRHVPARAKFLLSGFALAITTVECLVIDGIESATTYLYRSVHFLDSNGGLDLDVELFTPGTAATALSIKFNQLVTGAFQTVHLSYFDAK